MAQTTTTPAQATRGAAIAGIAFVVLFVAGWLLSGGTPEYDAPDQEWVDWFDDSGNRAGAIIGMFAMALSAIALVPFLAGLMRRLRQVAGDPEWMPWVAFGSGLLLSACTVIAAVAINQVAAAIEFGGGGGGDYPIPGADVLRQSEQLGFGIGLLGGGFASALLVAATSWTARGTTALPSWLSTAGLVVAVLLLFTVFFLPLALLALWVLAVSIVMLRSAPTAAA